MIPISHWLHLCKNLRARFAYKKKLLFKDTKVIGPKAICEKHYLDPKELAYVRRESMMDDLALKLISFDNLLKLAEFEEYYCLVLFLPFVSFTDISQSNVYCVHNGLLCK